ncbi:MAG: hypothetical protein P0S95_05375 [Rhabdochlamydiaceae bacterium]|nr:hypothetical protein [Candidatus Amphrikana amoebophyrae]
MQILLFTFTFLMILASFCLRLFFSTSTDVTLSRLNHATFQMRQELYTEIHKANLSKIKQKQPKDKKKKRPPYIPKRSLNTENGRFNLNLLFEKDPIKREFANKVLHHFYDPLFDNPNKLSNTLDEMHLFGLAKIQNGEKVALEDLLAISEENSSHLFTLIKGDKEKKVLPLQKVIILRNLEERKPLCFHQAAEQFIELLLPKSAYDSLVLIENNKRANKEKKMSQPEFNSFLQEQHMSDAEVERILEYFTFSPPSNFQQVYAPVNKDVTVERISSLIYDDENEEEESSMSL